MHQRSVHLVRILDRSGDTTLSYDPADSAAVREIEARFAPRFAGG